MREPSDDIPGGVGKTYAGSRAPVGPRTEIRASFVERVRRTRKRLGSPIPGPRPSGTGH